MGQLLIKTFLSTCNTFYWCAAIGTKMSKNCSYKSKTQP